MDPLIKQQQVYYARRELGLCPKCGNTVENSEKYVMCAACREKARQQQSTPERRKLRKEYMREYRAKENLVEKLALAMYKTKLCPAQELKSDRKPISSDHKCWDCVWSRWHGDRFFCPLVGCVKEKVKQEAADEYRNEDNPD